MTTEMEKNGFMDYLRKVHANTYPEILDDDLPDHFENWLDNLGWDFIELAQEWAKTLK